MATVHSVNEGFDVGKNELFTDAAYVFTQPRSDSDSRRTVTSGCSAPRLPRYQAVLSPVALTTKPADANPRSG